jgi:hypothetical protein
VVEWWIEWLRLRLPLYNSGWWKLDGPERESDGDAADLMLRFHLERRGDRTKHY